MHYIANKCTVMYLGNHQAWRLHCIRDGVDICSIHVDWCDGVRTPGITIVGNGAVLVHVEAQHSLEPLELDGHLLLPEAHTHSALAPGSAGKSMDLGLTRFLRKLLQESYQYLFHAHHLHPILCVALISCACWRVQKVLTLNNIY